MCRLIHQWVTGHPCKQSASNLHAFWVLTYFCLSFYLSFADTSLTSKSICPSIQPPLPPSCSPSLLPHYSSLLLLLSDLNDWACPLSGSPFQKLDISSLGCMLFFSQTSKLSSTFLFLSLRQRAHKRDPVFPDSIREMHDTKLSETLNDNGIWLFSTVLWDVCILFLLRTFCANFSIPLWILSVAIITAVLEWFCIYHLPSAVTNFNFLQDTATSCLPLYSYSVIHSYHT